MACLGCRQIAQQFAGIGIARGGGSGAVKAFRVTLHLRGFFPDTVNPKVFDQPDGAAGVEARHMLAPDQRDDFAKAFAVQVDQTTAMFVFLGRHPVKYGCRSRKLGPQHLGVAAIDARIVLFG